MAIENHSDVAVGLFKTECIRRGPFHTSPLKTIADVEYATMAWVEWYNNRRLHSTLGYTTPAAHEANYYAQQDADEPVGVND